MSGAEKPREFQQGMDQNSLRRAREEDRLSLRRKNREDLLQTKHQQIMSSNNNGIDKTNDKSEQEKLPKYFFFYGPLRDDTTSPYSHWSKQAKIKYFEAPGQNAKLYGYQLYKKQSGKTAFITPIENHDKYVIGRILKYNGTHKNFNETLTKINQFNHTDRGKEDDRSTVQIVTDVYLEGDDEKSEVISAITYVKYTDNFDPHTLIISNDWMRQNVVKCELKSTTSNRIRAGKGGTELVRRGKNKTFKKWVENRMYQKDDIICLDLKRGGFKFWAMCMKEHRSSDENKPQKEEIFADLLLNIDRFIRTYLIEHVEGFNHGLSTIVIDFCYKPNEFWWNGCSSGSDRYDCNCGNLVAGVVNSALCKMCHFKEDKQAMKSLMDIGKGAVITLNKTDGKMVRKYVDRNDKNDDDLKEKEHNDIVLRTNIESKAERQKICNLMERNFNEAMSPLIRACIDNKTSFVYKYNDQDIEVNIGDTNVWGLYAMDDNNVNNEELLCALIWRYVNAQNVGTSSKTTLMFEVLFLSTYEHVRFHHYGQKMVKEIALYCMSNGYDVMTVAAVPGHGESFWQSNGFKMVYQAAAAKTDSVRKRDKNALFKQNMLVFDDTPLFAKYV